MADGAGGVRWTSEPQWVTCLDCRDRARAAAAAAVTESVEPTVTLEVMCPLCGAYFCAASHHPAAGDGDLDIVVDELVRELKAKRSRHLALRAGELDGDVVGCTGSVVQF